MSGYFFAGSKSGGLTIQPSTLRWSNEDSYQISSTAPSFFAVKSSELREVRTLSFGEESEAAPTSPASEVVSCWTAKELFFETEKLPPRLRCSARTFCEPSSVTKASFVSP